MELILTNLENCFKGAIDAGSKYVGIKVAMVGFPKSEVIINEKDNFDAKLEYYKNAYSDDLTLKTFAGIKIVGFTHGNSFADIEKDLIG